jgi:peptidyl-tRNA hydrolase
MRQQFDRRCVAVKLKVLYRKNLKMSEGKIAAQAVHAAIGLGATDPMISVVVLGVSDKKYRELTFETECYRVFDAGYTEVMPLTETCAAFYEDSATQ